VARVGSLSIPAPEVGGDGVPVNVLVRPTDVRMRPSINGTSDGVIARVAYLGPTVKVDIDLKSGDRITVHVSRGEFAEMGLMAREWGRPWPTGEADADLKPEIAAPVSLEIRDARIFVEDFSI